MAYIATFAGILALVSAGASMWLAWYLLVPREISEVEGGLDKKVAHQGESNELSDTSNSIRRTGEVAR